jgi:hypothetical protein
MPIDFGSASALVTFGNSLADLAKVMVGLRDAAAFRDKAIEFQNAIIDAQNAAFAAQQERSALVEEIRSCKEKLAKMKKWDTEKKKYELKEVYSGAFAYVIRPDAKGSEPTHWLCTACFQNGEKSFLQARPRPHREDYSIFYCSRCRGEIRTGWKTRIGAEET